MAICCNSFEFRAKFVYILDNTRHFTIPNTLNENLCANRVCVSESTEALHFVTFAINAISVFDDKVDARALMFPLHALLKEICEAKIIFEKPKKKTTDDMKI